MTEMMPISPPLVTTHLWLRAEPGEESRTPLSPDGCRDLLKPGGSPFVKIHVERSSLRCFPDSDYEAAGCELVPSGSWSYAPVGTLIMGLSDAPDVKSSFEHHHLCYSKTFRNEPYWEEQVRHHLEGDSVLYDYTVMTDEKDQPFIPPFAQGLAPVDASQKFSAQLVVALQKFPAHISFRHAEAAFRARAEPLLKDSRFRIFKKRKVLLTLDDSEYSHYALKWACDNSVRRNDDVTILTVFDFVPISSMDIDASLNDVREVNEKLQRKGELHAVHTLRKYAKRFVRAGMKPQLVLLKGPVKHCILEYVDQHPQDMVICASRGVGAVKRIFLGSVSDYLVHNITSTVIVVKEPEDIAAALAADKEPERGASPNSTDEEQQVIQPGSTGQ